MKVRQDAWSEEDDLLLAETVLRHVREGSTQLHAFEEVGDKLDRTSAAVGFRWNAIVRKKYEQALKIAKKQRKERQRAIAKQQQNKPVKAPVKTAAPADDEVYHPEEFFRTPYTSAPVATEPEPAVFEATYQPVVPEVQNTYQTHKSDRLSLDDVIVFLTEINRNGITNERMEGENVTLKRQNEELFHQNKRLAEQLEKVEKDFAAMKDDYQALLQIMDRARRMVLLQDDPANNQSFRMDKNGNLEKMAK